MEILSFINSKAEREYLRDTGYDFSPLEAAFFVQQSASASMEQRFTAWEWIIENMPDCKISGRCPFIREGDSLHVFLREYIDLLKAYRIDLNTNAELPELNDREFELFNTLNGLWFDIPVPFKKGDILYDCTSDNPHGHSYCNGAFVFDHAYNNHPIRPGTDYSDMTASGYFLSGSGEVYYDSIWTYLNLDYYPYHLDGMERLLIAISNHLKGKLELPLLLAAQRTLILREQGIEEPVTGYTNEGLMLAGLMEDV